MVLALMVTGYAAFTLHYCLYIIPVREAAGLSVEEKRICRVLFADARLEVVVRNQGQEG
jgi:hypothetical protein